MAKSIGGSVGKGGKNRPEDVLVIQFLLNCVPARRGGPTRELILDGICGMLTTEAISRFQHAGLGFADGRVDVGGPTFEALSGFDPYPNQQLNLPPATSGGKRGGTASSNSWDPFGYYNPAGKNYMKSGYEPSEFAGKQEPVWKSGGQAEPGIKGGWKTHEGIKGSNQNTAGGKWGGPAEPGIKGGWKTHEGIKGEQPEYGWRKVGRPGGTGHQRRLENSRRD